jgi:hypothetical protein
VLRSGIRASRYAEDLLTIVRRMKASERSRPGALAALAMGNPSEFEGRLMAILDPDSSRRPMARRQILGIVSVAALIAILFAPLTPFRTARAEASSIELTPMSPNPAIPANPPVPTIPAVPAVPGTLVLAPGDGLGRTASSLKGG